MSVSGGSSGSGRGSGSVGGKRSMGQLGQVDLLARALAVQDLNRGVRCSVCPPLSGAGGAGYSSSGALNRRQELFCDQRRWEQVVAASLTMIDAMALQVQLIDAFLNTAGSSRGFSGSGGTKTEGGKTSQTKSQDRDSFHPGSRDASRDVLDKILAIRGKLGTIAPDAAAMRGSIEIEKGEKGTGKGKGKGEEWARQTPSERACALLLAVALPLARLPSRLQLAVDANPLLRGAQEAAVTTLCKRLGLPVEGAGSRLAGTLGTDEAFPPMATGALVHTVETLSLLQTHALGEDASGLSQRSVHSVVRALLQLEAQLAALCTSLQTSPEAVRLTTSTAGLKIRYRLRRDELLPSAVRGMQAAVREGLYRVIRAYKDVLLLVASNYNANSAVVSLYTPRLMQALKEKLIQM
mmetsp:Transcript_13481/g.30175  ORF Transcript_13481/g.30175 Transcript_13481/m.30175 type:complete len:409 (-) Transcript_13481:67-1293(-)